MKLFVYGTLKLDFPLHRYLADSTLIGEAVLGGFTLYSNHFYPIMYLCPTGKVIGELYDVDEHTLRNLDRIELGAGYNRTVVSEYDGEEVQAYYFNKEKEPGFEVWKHER